MAPMVLLSDESQQKDVQEVTQGTGQEKLLSLKNVASYTTQGIWYVGKGVFYVTYFTAPAVAKFSFFMIQTGTGMALALSKVLLKIIYFLSGQDALSIALTTAYSVIRLLAISGIVIVGYSVLSAPAKDCSPQPVY